LLVRIDRCRRVDRVAVGLPFWNVRMFGALALAISHRLTGRFVRMDNFALGVAIGVAALGCFDRSKREDIAHLQVLALTTGLIVLCTYTVKRLFLP
jgi:hypothetical protein